MMICAVIQMTSRADVGENLQRAASLAEKARARGAEMALFPENFALIGQNETDKLRHAEPPLSVGGSGGPIVQAMGEVARRLQMELILGGLPERGPDETHVYNSSVHLQVDGSIAAIYRKIHLFDVNLEGSGDSQSYRESASVSRGDQDQAVVTRCVGVPFGLSVCYDVRFPELYRRLSQRGAQVLTVPAAFTVPTGKDHWHVLLRARAIENQCFVLAAAQQGKHGPTRMTYGHSLIVDPWGVVLAECPDGEGVAVAELDFQAQGRIRKDLPALMHRVIY